MAKASVEKKSKGTAKQKNQTRPIKPRHSIRFTPDPLTTALVDLKTASEFNPSIVALVLNESFTGCALLLSCDHLLKKDQIVSVKVGLLDPIKAQIIWIKNLEENIFKIGLKFN